MFIIKNIIAEIFVFTCYAENFNFSNLKTKNFISVSLFFYMIEVTSLAVFSKRNSLLKKYLTLMRAHNFIATTIDY
ncbi:hypothetical protein TDB9533_03337 [Thalassocella blandensis]|nr:hypothetical protein TDB9533_03337 [Thalassocella blandensis]